MRKFFHKTLLLLVSWQLTLGTLIPLFLNLGVKAQESKISIKAEQEQKVNNSAIPEDNLSAPTATIDYNCRSEEGAYYVDNGISITEIKPYDERTLLSQLQEYEASLAATVYPNVSSLYQNVNRFQGNTSRASAMSLNVSTLPLPSIETTQGNTTTNSMKNTSSGSQTNSSGVTGGVASESNSNATGTGTENLTGATGSYSQVVNQAAVAPNIPTSLATAGSFPSSLSYDISPQDNIDKQTALTYQILNLRALLNQSFSDRMVAESEGGKYRFSARPQSFIGFTVNVEPKFTNAVAEVEITIRPEESNNSTGKSAESSGAATGTLSVISLFPQEKTYNVAKITDDKKSFAAGAIVNAINVGASSNNSKSTMYLVRDTDTVAFQREASKYIELEQKEVPDHKAVSIVWQFRPVLGQKVVAAGTKKVFALIAIPEKLTDRKDWNGEFTVSTQWRDISSGGVVKDGITGVKKWKAVARGKVGNTLFSQCTGKIVVPSSVSVEKALAPRVIGAKWQDNGNGQVSVIVDGENFSPGTQVMLGNAILNNQVNGLVIQHDGRMILTGSAQSIAKFDPMILGRYGNTKLGDFKNDAPTKNAYLSLEVKKVDFAPKDSENSVVILKMSKKSGTADLDYDIIHSSLYTPPVIEIGDSIFGLSNSPYLVKVYDREKQEIELRFLAPNNLLKENNQIIVRELVNRMSRASVEYPNELKEKLASLFSVKSIQKLNSDGAISAKGQNSGFTQLAITGTGFNKSFKVVAGGKPYESNDFDVADSAKLRVLSVPKTTRHIVIYQDENDPIRIDLSEPDPFPSASITDPVKQIIVEKGNSGNVILKGSNLDSIKSIIYESMNLSYEVDKSKSFFNLYIPSGLTASAGRKEITLVMKDDKRVPYTIVVR